MTLVDETAGWITTLSADSDNRMPGVGPTLPYPVKAAATRIRSAAWWVRRHGVLDTSAPRIVMYHRISDERDELAVTPQRFRKQMELLAAEGFRVCDVPAVAGLLAAGELPTRTIGLSFDDAFRDVAENALPVLAEHGFRATVFVTTGVTDGRCAFAWYRRQPPLLDWGEIAELDRGGTLGFEAHTVTHPNLLALDDRRAEIEIATSKAELEERLGRAVTVFSYPAGLYGERERRLVAEAGYRFAVTCEPGVNLPSTDRYALHRRQIDARDRLLDFRAKIGGGHDTSLPLRGHLPVASLWRGERKASMGELAAVELAVGIAEGLEREVGFDTRPPGSPEPFAQGRVVEQGLEGSCESRRLAGRHEQPCLPVEHELGQPADMRRDHRQAGRHRLEHGHWKPLGARGEHEDMRGGEDLCDVVAFPRDLDDARQPEAANLGLDLRPIGPVADDDCPERATLHAREGPNERGDVLRRLQPPDGHDRGRLRSRGRDEVVARVDCVPDHDGAVRVARTSREASHAFGLRDADRHRGQPPGDPLRHAVDGGAAPRGGTEGPAVNGEESDRRPSDPRGDPPEDACLRAVRVDDVRAQAPEQREELEEAQQVSPRTERAAHVAKRHEVGAGLLHRRVQRAGAVCRDGHVVGTDECRDECRDVPLGTARLGQGHEQQDPRTPLYSHRRHRYRASLGRRRAA